MNVIYRFPTEKYFKHANLSSPLAMLQGGVGGLFFEFEEMSSCPCNVYFFGFLQWLKIFQNLTYISEPFYILYVYIYIYIYFFFKKKITTDYSLGSFLVLFLLFSASVTYSKLFLLVYYYFFWFFPFSPCGDSTSKLIPLFISKIAVTMRVCMVGRRSGVACTHTNTLPPHWQCVPCIHIGKWGGDRLRSRGGAAWCSACVWRTSRGGLPTTINTVGGCSRGVSPHKMLLP